MAVLLAVALAGIVVSFLIGRSISRPVVAMSKAMRELAGGNFEVQLAGPRARDEVGQMAHAIEEFKVQAIAKAERETAEREEKNRELATARRTELHNLAESFEAAVGDIVENVGSASSDLENSAVILTKSSAATQELSHGRRAASEETSTNVQSVASATEEMASSVNEIGRQVADSNRIANEAVIRRKRPTRRIAELSRCAEPHRRRHQTDHHDRGADQSAGAQRDHRSGARRRRRPRLCGGRPGGQGARRADRQGDQRDLHADRRDAGGDAGFGASRSRRSAARSGGFRKSPRRSQPPSRSRARRPRKSPATCSRRRSAPRRLRPASPTSTAAPAKSARRRPRYWLRRNCSPTKTSASRPRSASSSPPSGLRRT